MPDAIRIIEDEHRSLAAVLNGLCTVAREIGAGRLEPDPDLLQAMIDYVREFPERLHHPKEDEQLFRLVRLRAPELAQVLDRLGQEHVRGGELLEQVGAALRRFRDGELASPFARICTPLQSRFSESPARLMPEPSGLVPILTPGRPFWSIRRNKTPSA